MYLVHLGIAFEEENLIPYLKVIISSSVREYHLHYFYEDDSLKSPVILCNDSASDITDIELKSVYAFLDDHKETLDDEFKKIISEFLDYACLKGDLPLIRIEKTSEKREMAVFDGTNLKIGIVKRNHGESKVFSLEGEKFSVFYHDSIVKKFPNLIQQIKDHPSQRLYFLFHP